MKNNLFALLLTGLITGPALAQDADSYAVTPEAKAELQCLRQDFEKVKVLLDAADRATFEMPSTVVNRMDFDLFMYDISGGAIDYRGFCGLQSGLKRSATVWTSDSMHACLDQELVKMFGTVNGHRSVGPLPKYVKTRGGFQKYLYEDLNAAIPYKGTCGL